MAKRGDSSEFRRRLQALNIPRGMLAVSGAFLSHELPAEVQIRLILIVGPAAQRDIARLMLSAFPVGILVMVLHAARALAATTLLVDEGATTTVASPDLASDRCRDGACSPSAGSSPSLTDGPIARPRLVGERSLLLERLGE